MQKHKQKDRNHHYIDDKAGAATLMLLGGSHHIVYGQVQPMLHTVNAFVLRPMVFKGPANILSPGNQFDIENKNQNTKQALQKGQRRLNRKKFLHKA